ncbi:unnamed protein product [Rotaria magnacalcarata]|uniref:Cilia- and flagella-associated protein 58 central coiled coil domain-containing protein n=1 Tax=Rotaria magnacalcarata TaxID=392030 RepID=A0A815L1B6_9BILA|nr:unnamed protein product [Rotaria magnacalcarata]CAF1587920.1 unnamed protein product [Rotaria magnacalcarata]
MSAHSDDDDDDHSQDDQDYDTDQQVVEDPNNQQQNAFVTDDADVELSNQQQTGEYEEIEPIEAQPPNEIDADEQERQQSGTPAFRTLEDLFKEGTLTGTQMALLKSKYMELQNALTLSRQAEGRLRQEEHTYLAQIEKQKRILEEGESFPDKITTEVQQRRKDLLKYSNDLACTNERLFDLEYKIKALEEDKRALEKEKARIPNQHDIDEKVKNLRKECDELKRQIAQKKSEITDQNLLLGDKRKKYTTTTKQFDELTHSIENLEAEYLQSKLKPAELLKQTDSLSLQRDQTEQEIEEMDARVKEQERSTRQLQEDVEKLKALTSKEMRLNDQDNQENEKLNEEIRNVLNLIAFEEAKLAKGQIDERQSNEAVKSTIQMGKQIHEQHSKIQKQKERKLRELKRSETRLRHAKDELSSANMTIEKLQLKRAAIPTDDTDINSHQIDLKDDIDNLAKTHEKQEKEIIVKQSMLITAQKEHEEVLLKQSDYRRDAVSMAHFASVVSNEREQKCREKMKAKNRLQAVQEDLQRKRAEIHEHDKRIADLDVKLKEFAVMYDIIKNERNKCVNSIQINSQKSNEMKEKLKLLQNEIEILRTKLSILEKDLQKKNLLVLASVVERDREKHKVEKQRAYLRELNVQDQQQTLENRNYNNLIAFAEKELVRLRKDYDTAVLDRNERSVQLVERYNEEVVFQEKVNVQDAKLKNAYIELRSRDDEIRLLELQIQEEKREIALLRKKLPVKRALDQELELYRICLESCQDRLIELEKILENPNDPARVRFLDGTDDSPEMIMRKLEQLEQRLSTKEEQSLEKDLILEQVNRLIERLSTKVDAGKDDTLSLAKKVNDLQNKIKDITRKMMATLSELTIYQSDALKLQQDKNIKEVEIQQCYERMEQGEPPSEDLEREWQRSNEIEQKRKSERKMREEKERETEHFLLPGGIITQAEPRPQAYAPNDDADIQVARPYGSHAPFKPSEPGANMRHIRKPNPKPIEI